MNLCNLKSTADAAKVECLGENLTGWWTISLLADGKFEHF
jgi:hypothetical protein